VIEDQINKRHGRVLPREHLHGDFDQVRVKRPWFQRVKRPWFQRPKTATASAGARQKTFYVLAMSSMLECPIVLCTIFTKCPEPRAHVVNALPPVGIPRGDLLKVGAAQPPGGTAAKNDTFNTTIQPTLNQIFSIRLFWITVFPFSFPFAFSFSLSFRFFLLLLLALPLLSVVAWEIL
jgi:hypothetical protein